uniref:Uncharacterized protein n=1 Tax=Otus sunia TaxID=257818 RepID=A0A8C8A8Y3_9STRI
SSREEPQAALCKATAGHRQLVLQLGGSADSPRLREERCRRSAELSVPHPTGLRQALLAGLQQGPESPEERRELERLWVLFLSALELFLQDLRRAQHLCQLFSAQGGGAASLRTGLGGWGPPSRRGSRRGGGPTQPPAARCLEEEIEQVRATLAEMESRANIPLWTVEATQPEGTGGSAGTPRACSGITEQGTEPCSLYTPTPARAGDAGGCPHPVEGRGQAPGTPSLNKAPVTPQGQCPLSPPSYPCSQED